MFPKLTLLAALVFFLSSLTQAASAQPNPVSCQHPLDANIANSCVVADEALWRGARPTPDAATALVNLGVGTVVSLELLNDDKEAFRAAQPADGIVRDIGYFQIRDWEPFAVVAPQKVDEHVAEFIAITRTQPAPIYVHCRSGQNRTGIMVAAYRIFNGADIEQTIAEMEKYGGIWARADAAYLRTLTAEKRAVLEKRIALLMPELQSAASIRCAKGRCEVVETKVMQPFSTDGCSMFPDHSLIGKSDWCSCCLVHDLAYWRGGTAEERLKADEELKKCVHAATGDASLAELMFAGVRVGGGPYFFTSYRWGYGWPYRGQYKALSPEEDARVAALRERYLKSNPALACPASSR